MKVKCFQITIRIIVLLTFVATYLVVSAYALSAQGIREFDRIAKLGMTQLTEEATRLFEEKYPGEDWDKHDFPDYVYTNDSVTLAYKIAVKEPGLLSVSRCYCFCEAIGHGDLTDCFIKKKRGWFGSRFDEHGASCDICYGQAMLSLLWRNIGATNDEITVGMDKKFAWLLKK